MLREYQLYSVLRLIGKSIEFILSSFSKLVYFLLNLIYSLLDFIKGLLMNHPPGLAHVLGLKRLKCLCLHFIAGLDAVKQLSILYKQLY